ncbi:hypothetical protein SEVIR_5G062200v4 [Setaria viridis]|uniref:Uncharacterized protein n=2 Tax=Setaria viridis TaxID=4556 RepID=A0A4U6UAT4_SETVI|nr:hypothetical protein SEVIR_5G062200v2 [Setaria viridis]
MAARSAAKACHALLGAVHAKLRASASQLRGSYRSLGASTSAALAAALAALLCFAAAFPRAAASFLPLLASTSLCLAAAGLFAAEERGAAGGDGGAVEAVVVMGGREGRRKAEAGLVQVIGEANASAYGARDGLQVGCFLRRSAWRGVDEDGEEVVFAGTLAPRVAGGAVDAAGVLQRLGHGELEEEVAALRVDRLAEGVWNSYFGGWSRWHDVDVAV